MSLWLGKLQELLNSSGLRATFDSERDVSKPCYSCGEAGQPRALRVVGCYLNEHRDDVVRPLCPGCAAGMGG